MKLIVKEDPKSPISEAYRTLRTNIEFTSLDADKKVFMATSAGMNEGKSTTIANLGVAIAENSKKTLIIDCDMRRPTIHKIFGLSNALGLSNYLIGQASLDEVIHIASDNLHICTSGTIPPNPSELLGSGKMKAFIEKMKSTYDVILLDTPPVMAVTDAQVLSQLTSGVILVVGSGKAQKDAAKRTKELLESVGAKILGAVLTSVDVKARSKYGYYYYYSSETETKGKK